jgi:hypothetical protein
MPLLTRAAILAANDIRTERVPVPEWGGDVIVATFSGADRWAFEVAVHEATKAKANGNGHPATPAEAVAERMEYVTHLVALALVDEAGHRLFSDTDVVALGKKSGVALTRVFRVAMRLNGIGDTEVERLQGN